VKLVAPAQTVDTVPGVIVGIGLTVTALVELAVPLQPDEPHFAATVKLDGLAVNAEVV
jgi:hypothetical protein